MGTDLNLLRDQCQRTLASTDLKGLGEREEGKVRDCYIGDGKRILVASDRVSCFDVVVGTIPFKGQVLNQLAAFWFEQTESIAPNHILSVPDPAVTIAKECQPVPVEFVVRGYLTGSTSTSIWTAYDRGDRQYCGHTLPEGLVRHEKLPEPLLTPTTKAAKGEHDAAASRAELIERGLISEELYDRAEKLVLTLFDEGTRFAADRGLILVDTKYELGFDPNGDLTVIDEIHTPDSSRYWYLDSYEAMMSQKKDPQALDKEYVRRWLGDQGYKGEGTIPEIPDDVRCEAARRYIEAFEREFVPNTDDPLPRIRRNLGL